MNERASDLIMGYLNGTLTESETEKFHSWINAAEANKKLFFEAKAIHDAKASMYDDSCSGEGWNRLLQKKRRNRTRRSLMAAMKYAAVIVIAITAASLYYTVKNQKAASEIQYVGSNGIGSDILVLPDGTKISIAANTVLGFSDNYGVKNRVVHLKGEAFFDVAEAEGKKFIVKSDEQEIEVLGTKFNVSAYPADSIMTTTLLEGTIRLTGRGAGQPTVLHPDQQAVYNRNNKTIEINDVEASLYASWTEGYYYFSGQDLNEIFRKLSCVYGITCEILSGELKSRKFTGTFYRGQSIQEILEIVNASIPIKYEIEHNHLTISQ